MLRIAVVCLMLGLSFSCGFSEDNPLKTPGGGGKADNPDGTEASAPPIQVPLQIEADTDTMVSLPLNIRRASISNTILTVEVEYVGGCAEHAFQAVYQYLDYDTLIPYGGISIFHQATNDTCTDQTNKKLEIDLASIPLYKNFKQNPVGSQTQTLKVYSATALDPNYRVISINFFLGGERMSAADLEGAFANAAQGAIYVSEAEYAPTFISADLADGEFLVQNEDVEFLIKKSFGPQVLSFFQQEGAPLTEQELSIWTIGTCPKPPGIGCYFLPWGNAANVANPDSAASWNSLWTLLANNLAAPTVVVFGPKGASGYLAKDAGLYALLIVGETADYKLAGLMVGEVRTK